MSEAKYALVFSPRFLIFLILLVLLAGSFYLLGQYLGAAHEERSIQRQYDLMKAERQELLEGARRSLERKGLHVEGEAK